jgi:hypothetical protein
LQIASTKVRAWARAQRQAREDERILAGDLLQGGDPLAALSKRPGAQSSVFLDYVGGLLTLGFFPAFAAELRFIDHLGPEVRREHREPERYAAVDRSVRPSALRAGARVRAFAVGAVFLAALITALLAWIPFGMGYRHEGTAVLMWMAAGFAWVPTLLGQLALHHRAVRRHDAAHLALKTARYRDRQALERLMAHYTDGWSQAAGSTVRWTWGAALLASMCFPFAWVIFPLWLTRAFQVPLELHRRRERLGRLGPCTTSL